MPLSVNYLQAELFSSANRTDIKGAGDSIGIAITRYLNTMFPIISGPLKSNLDIQFIQTLNSVTYSNSLKVVLSSALDTYKLGLIPIISTQNPGFVAIPPLTPLRPILSSPQTKESFVRLFSIAIDGWFRTGTYSVLGGPPIPWS